MSSNKLTMASAVTGHCEDRPLLYSSLDYTFNLPVFISQLIIHIIPGTDLFLSPNREAQGFSGDLSDGVSNVPVALHANRGCNPLCLR